MILYQETIRSGVKPCATPEQYTEILSRPFVRMTIEAVRKTLAEAEAEKDEDVAKALRNKAGALKRQLPAFIYQATFKNGRRKQEDAVLNGLYMVDFDHVAGAAEAWRIVNAKLETSGLRSSVLLAHITPSGKGLRIVAKADIKTGNLADNANALAAVAGLTPDEACKDATRLSFACLPEDVLFINNEIFTYYNSDYDSKYGAMYRRGTSAATRKRTPNKVASQGSNLFPQENVGRSGGCSAGRAVSSVQAAGGGQPSGAAVSLQAVSGDDQASSLTYRGVAYADIIAAYWAQNGGEPVEGERNVRLHKLATQLRYICENSVDKLLQVMPRYGLAEDEVRHLCESAVQNKLYVSMPKTLRAVLDACGISSAGGSQGSETKEEEARRLLNQTEERYLERLNKLRLPTFFKAVTAGVPSRVRNGALLASLPMIYTLASRVQFEHFDGSPCRLSGMTFIVGPAASGKSFILELDRLLMEPIRAADKGMREVERKYRESRELNKNKKEQAEMPHPVIRITPIQISNTMLARRMRDAVDSQDKELHLHVYSCETELATAIRAQKGGSWIEKNDIYCKAFHNERWGMDYANDQAVNGEVQVNLNLVVCGTEDAFDKLIPPSTVLSGLPTRLMYFAMPLQRFQMLDKRRLRRTSQQEDQLRQAAYILDRAQGHIDTSELQDRMWDWCAKIARRAEIENDEELDDLRKRTAIIGLRAGVAFALVSNLQYIEQDKPITIPAAALDFAEYIADYVLDMQYIKFAVPMREQKQLIAAKNASLKSPMCSTRYFNELADSFNLDDVYNIRGSVSHSAARMMLKRWKDNGLIRNVPRKVGVYQKIIKTV